MAMQCYYVGARDWHEVRNTPFFPAFLPLKGAKQMCPQEPLFVSPEDPLQRVDLRAQLGHI